MPERNHPNLSEEHHPTTLAELVYRASSVVAICAAIMRNGRPLTQPKQDMLLNMLDTAHCLLDEVLHVCPDAEIERQVKLKLL